MRENAAVRPHPIHCRLEAANVVMNIGSHDRLYLTHDEARNLASDLEMQVVCSAGTRTMFSVADVTVTAAEAWELVCRLGEVVNAGSHVTTGGAAWKREGF